MPDRQVPVRSNEHSIRTAVFPRKPALTNDSLLIMRGISLGKFESALRSIVEPVQIWFKRPTVRILTLRQNVNNSCWTPF